MKQNPYATPQAATDVAPVRDAAPRPISVWVFIIFIGVFALLFTLGLLKFLSVAVLQAGDVGNIGFLAASIVWRIALIAVCIALARSIFLRRAWSRWIAIVMIIGFAAFSIFGQDSANYLSDAERAGGFFGRTILLPLLCVWWLYAVGFSAKAKRYFLQG